MIDLPYIRAYVFNETLFLINIHNVCYTPHNSEAAEKPERTQQSEINRTVRAMNCVKCVWCVAL